jgi:hypothetical protein
MRVVGSRNVAELFSGSQPSEADLDRALESGALAREKVGGYWMYGPDQAAFAAARDSVLKETQQVAADWLLTPNPIVRSTVAGRLKTTISREAVEAYLREHIRAGALLGLGLISNKYDPYLALARGDDAQELERQTLALSTLAERGRPIATRALPEPEVPRAGNAWRDTLLRHGEFLRLGTYIEGSLVPWRPH